MHGPISSFRSLPCSRLPYRGEIPLSEESNEIVPAGEAKPIVPANQPQKIAKRPIDAPPATAPVKALSSVLTNIGDNVVTERAEEILSHDDEQMIWQEKPSLVLLIPRLLKYVAIMLVIIFLCVQIDRYAGPSLQSAAEVEHDRIAAALRQHDSRLTKNKRRVVRHQARAAEAQRQAQADADATAQAADDASNAPLTDDGTDADAIPVHHEARILVRAQYLAAFILAGMWIAWLLKLLTTKYSASSQRLIVEQGIFHSVNSPYELHQLGDAVISRSLIPKLFGIGNLNIVKPPITLLGLRNPEYIRDVIRQGGQQEAQRTDKIRYRK